MNDHAFAAVFCTNEVKSFSENVLLRFAKIVKHLSVYVRYYSLKLKSVSYENLLSIIELNEIYTAFDRSMFGMIGHSYVYAFDKIRI